MTNKEMAEASRKALEEFNRLPPAEQINRLMASGTINANGEVMLGPKRDLQIILDRLKQYSPMREDAKRTRSAQKMRRCLDAVYGNCQRFKRSYPPYFPESQRLDGVFQLVENCHAMPTGSGTEEEAFVEQTDECLIQLRSEVERLL